MEQFIPKNIIIRMPNWIGDAVMATPIIQDVKHRWPHSTLTVMCQKNIAPLLLNNTSIDELFAFTKPNGFLRKNFSRGIVKRLQQGHYDLGILLTNSFSSALWFWQGKVKRRVGYAMHFRRWLLNEPLASPIEKGKEHLVKTYKRLLLPLGIPLSETSPALYLNHEEIEAAKEILKSYFVPSQATLIGINPGAAYGSAKCWPPERFKEVAKQLLKDPHKYLLFFGDKSTAPLVNEICEGFDLRAINLAGKTTLRELISLISLCNTILTNDSGPMHIAAALKKPLVALFGSTNATATGPYGGGTVIYKGVSCSPCYLRTCPIDFKCMKEIHVDEVVQAIEHSLR